MSAPLTTYDLAATTPISRALFRLAASDRSLVARTGHVLTHSRAGAASARGGEGRLFRPGSGSLRYHSAEGATPNVFSEVGLLLEPSRQNRVLRSQELDNAAWTKTNLTVAADAVRAPDGTVTADKLIETAVNAAHKATQAVTVAAGSYFTLSAFVRAAERNRFALNVLNGGDAAGGTFRLDTLATTTAASGAGVVTDVGLEPWAIMDGELWYRIWCSGRVNVGSTSLTGEVSLLNAAGASSYLGVVATGAYVWGVQLEATTTVGSSPTSYEPTTTAAATRAADAALATTVDWAFQDLTIYFRLQRPLWSLATGSLDRTPAILTLGNAAPRCALYFAAATREVAALLDPGTGGATASQVASLPTGNVIDGVVELKDLRTAGKIRIDVGAGWGAYSSTVDPISGWSTADLTIGDLKYAPANILGTGLQDLTIAPAGRTLAQMRGLY